MTHVVAGTDHALITEGTGKALYTFPIVGTSTIYLPVTTLADDHGNTVDYLSAAPSGAEVGLAVRQVGSVAVTAATLPLPTNASQDRTTAAAPSASRLSTGAAFYDARDRNWTISETIPVSGTFWQATQPVSVAGTLNDNIAQWGGSITSLGQKTSVSSVPVVIASDQSLIADNIVQIGGTTVLAKTVPTGGSGQSAMPVYTNAVQLATYTIVAETATGTLTANTRKDYLSLEHLVSSTKTVKVRRILISGYQSTALVGHVYCKVFRGSAATSAGTVQVPIPTNPATTAADVTAKILPTITAATLVFTSGVGELSSATANTGFPQVVMYDWQEDGETQPLILRAGVVDTLTIALFSTVAHAIVPQLTVVVTEE